MTIPFQRITETSSCWGAPPEHLNTGPLVSAVTRMFGIGAKLGRFCMDLYVLQWLHGLFTCLTRHSKLPLGVCVWVTGVCYQWTIQRVFLPLPRDFWDGLYPHLTVIRNKESNQSLLNWPIQRTGVSGRNQFTFTHASWKKWHCANQRIVSSRWRLMKIKPF